MHMLAYMLWRSLLLLCGLYSTCKGVLNSNLFKINLCLNICQSMQMVAFREIKRNLCNNTFLVFYSHLGTDACGLESRCENNEVQRWDYWA